MNQIRSTGRRLWPLLGVAALLVVLGSPPAPAAEIGAAATTFTQPLIPSPPPAADPMIRFVDGYYFLSYNKAGGRGSISMRISRSLAGLASAPDTVLYRPGADHPADSRHNIWPIAWLLPWGGKYYIYGEGNDGTESRPRSFVLEADNAIGPYRFKANLPGPGGNPAYQTNPVPVGGQLHLVTAQYPNLFIARMTNPWTRATEWRPLAQAGSKSYHCTATADGGRRCVVEGASPVVRDGRVFTFFSAGGYESPDYCVGMLSAAVGADLTVQANWTMSNDCVLRRKAPNGPYGPGTLNVFSSPDGTEQWAVYHVKTSSAIDPSGLDRVLMATPIGWSGGVPVLPPPDDLGTVRALPSGDPGT